jgi:hypothetical protein
VSKIEALEEEIRKLSPNEWEQLRDWVFERDAEEWDRKIERDASSGRLDELFADALADHRAGKSTEV